MITITIPPDLEARLAEEARRRGSTPEAVAIEGLRRAFPTPVQPVDATSAKTMYDLFAPYIGVVEGSGEAFSENGGQRFADDLEAKHKAGRS